ncbi:MAG: DUF5318 family protein [Actinomycetota bacterium]|nr:DUF5318 domain-containing protein [Actinomycetota bacterium]
MQGRTDYTLAKRALLDEFRRGGLDRLQICDAHPELVRVARNIGKPIPRPCPVCADEASLRSVRYVFGDQLKHLSGRPVYPDDWADELNARYDEFRCYEIEVCVECLWNHLAACYLMGRSFNGSTTPAPKAVEQEG